MSHDAGFTLTIIGALLLLGGAILVLYTAQSAAPTAAMLPWIVLSGAVGLGMVISGAHVLTERRSR